MLDALNAASLLSSASTPSDNAILNDVLMPTSMGIDIPHIDPSKIIQSVDVYTLDSSFAEELEAHGIHATSMTYSEYEALESTWTIPSDLIESVKVCYPELQDADLTEWTYGDYKDYCSTSDRARLLDSLTDDDISWLNEKSIQISDLDILFKEYYTLENVMLQSDEELQSTLETAYAYTYDSIVSEAASARSSPPSDKYTYVYFPRYNNGNGDYFLNSVLTTTYWMNQQADRALKTQQRLYNSSSTVLCCTNMYGTYSYSQGGAHEGIDFTHPSSSSTPTIYAVFNGVKQNASAYHQLSVYDANSPDEPKTYTYLHMNSISASGKVSVGDAVGTQGKEGNATGYHVHFEVHAGCTTSLSSGTDHVIDSLSPYRLVDYIGCLTHDYAWQYNRSYHWRVCSVCGYSTGQSAHSYSNGICTSCGCSESVSTANHS